MAERFRIPWTTGKMEISHSDCATIPPAELVEEWADMLSCLSDHEVFSMAAQWGADQELEACCEWIKDYPWAEHVNRHLLIEVFCSARRPKPPSLKEQALNELHSSFDRGYLKKEAADTIRRALEQLDD